MLQAKAKGFLGRTYILLREESEVARIELGFFKEEGTLIVGDERSNLRRQKERRTPERFVLTKENGDVVVQAGKPAVWKSQFTITYGDMTFDLSKASIWKPKFILSWNGEETGAIYPTKWYNVRNVSIDLPEAIPLEIQAFVLWLAVVQWIRDAAAAS